MWTPSDAMLASYLAGECSETEASQVERWAAADPANRAQLDEVGAIWGARRPAAWDVEEMWAVVRRAVRNGRARSARIGRVSRSKGRRWWSLPLAAAASVALVVGGSLRILRTPSDVPPAPAVVPMREYVTPRGHRATFQLSDGTRLILSVESRLRVPADYGRAMREVHLEGEALFEVVHDSTRPFRVRAKDAVVEDLGTRFDVRAYAEDSAVAVAVAQGAVALGRAIAGDTMARSPGSEPQGIVLRQGQLGTLDSLGRVTTDSGAVVARYLAWSEGRLHFADAPLPEVLRVVGRWYDLDLRAEGATISARRVTAEFDAQSEEELLRALAIAVGARVVRSGRVVTLRPKS